MLPRSSAILGLLLLLHLPLSGQVVFSRRVYKEAGPSYQQIWNWNPADNTLTPITVSPRDHYQPSCSGRRITFVSPRDWNENAKLWSFDRNTHSESVVGPLPREAEPKPAGLGGCSVSAVKGPLKACATKGDLTISRDGNQLIHLRPGNDDLPIQYLAWSPSGKWLLIGTLGMETSSTSPQSDFFVVELATLKLLKAGSGNNETWLPGRDDFFYTTPRDMASLAGARRPRGVWVEHLMVFHAASGKSTAITSGLTNNMQPHICGK
jgi:hypothetical protein